MKYVIPPRSFGNPMPLIDWTLFGELLLQWLTLTFMLVGLVGLLIPIFPGIPIIWLAALVYGGFQLAGGRMDGWGWFFFVLITLLMILGTGIDNVIIARKLRETGTPWKSILIGYGVGIVSSLFLTPFAALLMTPLELYAAEYWRLRDTRLAFNSTKSWMVGFSWALLALFAIGFTMIVLWGLWAWL